jgi:hypothetical protein
MLMRLLRTCSLSMLFLVSANFSRAGDTSSPSPSAAQPGAIPMPPSMAAQTAADDARREQAIAGYTQKMKDANYPALFDKAAQEFNVPPDVLKAVSFAETRWTQLEWPPGETASPDNGMPHAYGIMSLWDNPYFGHGLQQAASLIGQDAGVLKTDVFQNMRGGAALLRQIYDQTPKPADAPDESQIESWRKAIAKYTGIPQPELREQHALRVYEYMNEGYHQYGFEWNKHPVNLGPMKDDVARITAAARARWETKMQPQLVSAQQQSQMSSNPPSSVITTKPDSATNAAPGTETDSEQLHQRRLLLGLIAALLAVAVIYHFSRKRGGPADAVK